MACNINSYPHATRGSINTTNQHYLAARSCKYITVQTSSVDYTFGTGSNLRLYGATNSLAT